MAIETPGYASQHAALAALGLELIELENHGVTGFCCGGGGGVVSNQHAAPLRRRGRRSPTATS